MGMPRLQEDRRASDRRLWMVPKFPGLGLRVPDWNRA